MIRFLLYLGWLVGGYIALAIVASVVGRTVRAVRRWRRARHRRRRSPKWSISLLVDVDEDRGLLHPRVQLRGAPPPRGTRLEIELVGEGGDRSRVAWRPLSPALAGTDVRLSSFAPPANATLRDVLRSPWEVVIRDRKRERARWRVHLTRAGDLDAEGEIRSGDRSPGEADEATLVL